MVPPGEIFGVIPIWVGVFIFAGVGFGINGYLLYMRVFRLIMLGKKENRFNQPLRRSLNALDHRGETCFWGEEPERSQNFPRSGNLLLISTVYSFGDLLCDRFIQRRRQNFINSWIFNTTGQSISRFNFHFAANPLGSGVDSAAKYSRES